MSAAATNLTPADTKALPQGTLAGEPSWPLEQRWNRRMLLSALLASCCGPGFVRAQTADRGVAGLFASDPSDRAIDAGVKFLIATQRPDGSIADRGHELAMTSLSIMAIASTGIQPRPETPRGRAVQSALDYVLHESHQDPQGYFGNSDQSRMYGHGITTLMLTEMLGMAASPEDNRRIHEALVIALELILAAQGIDKPEPLRGGWRYTPRSRDSDLSVSVWQLMALRSARNDGLAVPVEAIERALNYLRQSYTSPLRPDGNPVDPVAGFSYTPGTRHPTFAMTAAGSLAMQICGQYESPLVAGATEWLYRNPPQQRERFFHYGLYYYAQAMHQVGGKYGRRAAELVPTLLLDRQRQDGAWVPQGEERNIGLVYATALSILSLSVRYHYLPIYQR